MPNYDRIVYKTEDVIQAIVNMASKKPVGIIGNREIYETITGLQRFNNKQWETLKSVLREISAKIEYEVDGNKYLISTYSPMLRDKFNFYADDARNRPVAGFSVQEER